MTDFTGTLNAPPEQWERMFGAPPQPQNGHVERLQTRSLEQMQVAAFPGRYRTTVARIPSTREAMGVPSVFRALSLIANVTGELSLEAYRRSVQLSSDDTPRVVIRPDPFRTPDDFLSLTAFNMGRYGEGWLWAAKRDLDGQALAVLSCDPREVIVAENDRDPVRPIITWRGRRMDNDDFRLMRVLPDPDNPHRGIGPLQACGAATSVAVESQEWAANFFGGGGIASVLIKAARELNDEENEADDLRDAWMAKPNNVPRVIDTRIEDVTYPGVNPEAAQLSESRLFQVGEIARMFGIPGPLLEYNSPGSSLHYQNDSSIWVQFQRACLSPNYLEKIEQTFSEFLTRSTIVRFNLGGLLRSDPKTRFEVYDIAIRNGIISAEEARMAEGFAPGDIENRPVPAAPPSAIPTVPQLRSVDADIRTAELRDLRCPACGKLAGKVSGAAEIKCRGCGALAVA